MDLAQIAADFAAIRAELPTVFTFGAASYSGFKTVQMVEGAYEEAGERFQYRFSLTISVADFTTLPAAGDTVTIAGTIYRVLRRQDKTLGVVSRLDLGERYA
jgi:hypothetical protein